MKIIEMHLLPVTLKLKNPFISSHESVSEREITIIGIKDTNGLWGYGELETFSFPYYTAETQKTARVIIQTILAPLLKNVDIKQPEDITKIFNLVAGNQMAKAAIETAYWDLFAKTLNLSLASLLAKKMNTTYRAKVAVGISIGMQSSLHDLQREVISAKKQGYTRIKIKVKSYSDLTSALKIIHSFSDLAFMIDANSSFNLNVVSYLKNLDLPNLVMIEQPLRTTDFVDHANLQSKINLPICLDENIFSLDDVKTAFALGSARAINLKVSRVGGIANALEIIRFCWQNNLIIWCGGMLEGGIGRATNLAVASLAGLDFPGDISASSRYYFKDIIKSNFILCKGQLELPSSTGIGVSLFLEYENQLQETTNIL